jgi:hypothetical protein
MHPTSANLWSADWLVSLPLVVLTSVLHVAGLGLIYEHVVRAARGDGERHPLSAALLVRIGATVLLATLLHGLEAFIWAVTYRLLGALPSMKVASLYSLNAMTTYGHESVFLEHRWELMGALESLNGIVLFGLTTAFLFRLIQKVWPTDSLGSAKHT